MTRPFGAKVVKEPNLPLFAKVKLDSQFVKEASRAVRFGRDSFDDQIKSRQFIDVDGRRKTWGEPHYAGGRMPSRARLSERILWDAALGLSNAGREARYREGSRVGVTITVDDRAIRRQAALIGNGIVSQASYFPFVTGVFSKRQTPSPAIPEKPSRRSTGRGARPDFAMFLFLLLSYKYTMTDQEVRRGIATPPKNLGVSPASQKRFMAALRRAMGRA